MDASNGHRRNERLPLDELHQYHDGATYESTSVHTTPPRGWLLRYYRRAAEVDGLHILNRITINDVKGSAGSFWYQDSPHSVALTYPSPPRGVARCRDERRMYS